MKRIGTLFGIICTVLLTVHLSFGQTAKNLTQLGTQNDVIRNETIPGANTRGRIADMYKSIFLSSPNIYESYTNPSWLNLTYTGISPTTVTVGGLASGSSISGLTLNSIIQSIVAPYVNPVFSSFSITGQSTTVETGTTLSGSRTFTWGITLNSGVVPNIDLFDITAGSTLLAATTNDGTQAQTITTIQLNSNGATQSWRGVGNNTTPAGTFNSSAFTVTGRYLRFFGAVAASPTNSATVRAVSAGTFHTGVTTFSLNTGSSLTKFVVALPPGVTISSVIDVTALNAVITSEYILTGTINVLDAGSTNRLYNIYEMTIGSPYSSTHNHSITTAN